MVRERDSLIEGTLMKKWYSSKIFCTMFLVFFMDSRAKATLGEPESRITENEVKVLKARSRKTTPAVGYTVHEITLDGTTLKEYADLAGLVFAVSWQGIKTPDFSVIFGSYYSEYKTEREKIAPERGKRIMNTKAPNIVVSSGGHMRNLHGFAYLPALVPKGVSLDSL